MKVSEQWLREWADPPVTTDTLVEQLTSAGLEVDSAAALAPPMDKVVVGNLLEVVSHPEADRLSLCRVDAGTGDILNVVCGADNVYQGHACAGGAGRGALAGRAQDQTQPNPWCRVPGHAVLGPGSWGWARTPTAS